MSAFVLCQDCLEPLFGDYQTLETGRCDSCQSSQDRQNYDPNFDDRFHDIDR